MKERPDIRLLSDNELIAQFKNWELPAFRAKQVSEWIWKHGVNSFHEMSSLPIELRKQLEEKFCFRPIRIDATQQSKDGTIKLRLRLYDDHLVEAVLIPVKKESRFTVCVSCQVGCSLACNFCATGKMQRERNLEPGEIYDQVKIVGALAMAHYGHPLTNVVFMGMGEPMLAYKPVMDSIHRITSPNGLGMSSKRITVSTAGVAKMIKKMADDGTKVNLALSLHAADDVKRSEIMAINDTNNLEALIEAAKYFMDVTGNRITYEYIALGGFNLSAEDAYNLIKIVRKVPGRINVIEYNPIDDAPYKRADFKEVDHFAKLVRQSGAMITVRKSRGLDIDAACGQLANKGE